MAPVVGLMAESIGRKKVIVPSLYALTVPTLLAATSQSLHSLIFWRFMQGLFVPGVIVVMMAYINEEFARPLCWPRDVGVRNRNRARWVSGTLHFGFSGPSLRLAARPFVAIGLLNLAGAIVVQRALPKARNFVRAIQRGAHSLAESLEHLRNPRLLAVFGMGFAACFASLGVFTYVNFYLAAPPFHLNSAQLGSVFFVYLLGLIVTPLSGRFLDRYGVRHTALLAFGFALVGLTLTLIRNLPLIIAGLALFSSGVFIFQAVGTVQTGIVARRARSSAAASTSRSTTSAEAWARS